MGRRRWGTKTTCLGSRKDCWCSDWNGTRTSVSWEEVHGCDPTLTSTHLDAVTFLVRRTTWSVQKSSEARCCRCGKHLCVTTCYIWRAESDSGLGPSPASWAGKVLWNLCRSLLGVAHRNIQVLPNIGPYIKHINLLDFWSTQDVIIFNVRLKTGAEWRRKD